MAGLSKDCGPILAGALCAHKGKTLIYDSVYNGRFSHISELNKMGYDLSAFDRRVFVRGTKAKFGRISVTANDIRAGASLIIGALSRQSETIIAAYPQIFRGYANLAEDLERLGASIQLVPKHV